MGEVGGCTNDYKTNLSSQLNWHWTCQLELSLAKIKFKNINKQAGAELCQAQGSAKLTASYSLASD